MVVRLAFVACAASIMGCSGGGSTPQPLARTLDAAAVAQAALQEYDKNKNGSIEGAELDACPALKYAMAAIDKNNDQKLSAAEIEKRVAGYPPRHIGISCEVTLDGKLLPGATVIFEPEKFMGSSFKTATATTDRDGQAGVFQLDRGSVAELPAGFYRIRITKEGTKIPARYNTQTTLGREIAVEPRQEDVRMEFALTSR